MTRFSTLIPLVFATVIASSGNSEAVQINMVSVQDAGNGADSTSYGSVEYSYQIGRYEVTNSQYTEFLNRVDPNGANALNLYSTRMEESSHGGILFRPNSEVGNRYQTKDGFENKPVVHVDWNDAARFTNWLHNGQQNGLTEQGAYNLSSGIFSRSPGAVWFLPTEDEWYKSAYFRGSGDYWQYPTQSDVAPLNDPPPGGSNSANYGIGTTSVVPVGSFIDSAGPYGTFDQAGNVWEWSETLVPRAGIVQRGGGWGTGPGGDLTSSGLRHLDSPFNARGNVGFRVASIIPEPSGLFLCVLSALTLNQRSLRYGTARL